MAFDFIPPPAFDFLPRDASRRVTKSLVFLTLKPIKQYILGFNSVKLCCGNYILPIGTAKSVGMGPISCQAFLGAILPSVDSTTFWDKGRSILPMDDPSCQTEIEGNTDL